MHIIAGLYRQRRLLAPKTEKTRPTASRLRESLFNICQNYIENARFLDLFAGSGAIGLEALSRGAKQAIFIDNSQESVHCIQKNIHLLHVENQTQVFFGHVLHTLKKLEEQAFQFDIIFADPPYRTPFQPNQSILYSEKLILQLDQSSLLAPGGTLFIEEAFDVQPNLTNLQTLSLINSRRMGPAVLQQYKRSFR